MRIKPAGILVILLLIPMFHLLFHHFSPVYAQQSRAVLLISDRSDSKMVHSEEEIKKHLVKYRLQYGYNASTLPILAYDFNDPKVRKYVSEKLGVRRDDLLFLGIVVVEKNLPVKVLTKITRPSDADRFAHLVIQEITGKSGSSGVSVETGSIRVTSSPEGAKVFLGGVYKGRTPITLQGVHTGKHVVTLVQADSSKIAKEVTVTKGQTAACAITFTSKFGSIALTSTPGGGKVYVDGKYHGVTPLTLDSLTPGNRKITVIRGADKWEKTVNVEAGSKQTLAADLSKKEVAVVPTPAPTRKPPDVVVTDPTPLIVPSTPSHIETPVFSSSGDVKEAFIPRSSQNEIFQISVTNLEEVTSIKDYYKPKPGFKFVVVYISQQNVSNELQVYTGKFVVVDQGNTPYESLDNLSNFWSVVLKVGGMRLGYLVYEMPEDSQPMAIMLHGLKMAPLSVSLR